MVKLLHTNWSINSFQTILSDFSGFSLVMLQSNCSSFTEKCVFTFICMGRKITKTQENIWQKITGQTAAEAVFSVLLNWWKWENIYFAACWSWHTLRGGHWHCLVTAWYCPHMRMVFVNSHGENYHGQSPAFNNDKIMLTAHVTRYLCLALAPLPPRDWFLFLRLVVFCRENCLTLSVSQ